MNLTFVSLSIITSSKRRNQFVNSVVVGRNKGKKGVTIFQFYN